LDNERHSTSNGLLKAIWNKENLWVLVVAAIIILTYTCATIGNQPEFVYGGF